MITTYTCNEPCDSITVQGKKLLAVNNIEYAITSVTYEYDDTDLGKGLTWLTVTLRKRRKHERT